MAALAGTLIYARAGGRSPLECLSYRLDGWVVRIVREGSDGSAQKAAAATPGISRATWVRLAVYAAVATVAAAIVLPIRSELF